MKAKIYLVAVIILLIGGIATSQYRKPEVHAGPDALLYFVGDTEHELTRMPARFAQMSDADEIAIGNELAKGFDNNEVTKDPDALAMQQYVSRIGLTVAAHAHRKLPFKFHYMRDRSFVNAFALPGGHVVIGAGLIELMDSEDELASVLGHEIEHIDHYHCAERVQTERALHKLPLGSLAAIPVEIFQAGYSKTDELEADREGVRLAAIAGYSPEAAVRLFQKFDELYRRTHNPSSNPQEEASRVIVDSISGYFQSHPPSRDRIEQVQQLIATEKFHTHEREIPLETDYILKSWQAGDSFQEHKFEKAISLAAQALHSKSDYETARRLRAESEFLLARFSEAAADYQDLLSHHVNLATADRYADVLAAVSRAQAAAQYAEWLSTAHAEEAVSSSLRANLAGLRLLVGSNADAQQVAAKAVSDSDGDVIARLGKWYYRSGDYAQSVNLLQAAVELRPNNIEYQLQLAWALIEQQKFESSLSRLNTVAIASPEAVMARSIASWRAKEPDPALSEFNAVTREDAYWKNPTWTSSLYAPSVGIAIKQMEDETEKHRQAALKPQSH